MKTKTASTCFACSIPFMTGPAHSADCTKGREETIALANKLIADMDEYIEDGETYCEFTSPEDVRQALVSLGAMANAYIEMTKKTAPKAKSPRRRSLASLL